MIKNIIKSCGTVEKFDSEKLNKMAIWADERGVDWSTVAIKAFKKLSDGCSTTDINKALLDVCAESFDEKHYKFGGRILAGMIYKDAFGGRKSIPTLKNHHDRMVSSGYWENLSYSDVEFELLESIIDHTKDLTYSLPEIKQINEKYLTRNRITDTALESPQFMYMGMAMANMVNMPESRRIEDVIKLYTYLSNKQICAPTPFMVNMRTPSKSYASCAIFSTKDSAASLAAGDHIAYMLTCASAGIGAHLKTRSKGDGVRKGTTVHQGKRPYYKVTEAMVSANLQAGRGGSATMYLNVLDPEIEDIVTWKNKKTASKIRVDGIHYSIGYNMLFAKKSRTNEPWMLVSYADSPELYEAMYDGDQDEFVRLYEEYELSDKPRKMVESKKLAIEVLVQGQESGQVYLHRTDELNRHTPHKDTIYSSNLCAETAFPSMGYDDVFQLNEPKAINDDGTIPEIGLCSLAAIVARNVPAKEWGDVAYYCALMIDNVIDIMDYPFKNLKYTAQARRNIGVGITDLAGLMAVENLKYSSIDGKRYMYRLSELHSFSMISASLRLAKERGVCKWSHKTKWADGWLPIDTMNKNVSKVVGQKLLLDWETLREEVIDNGGIRHSSLINYMPNESSSIATNGCNSILPARSIRTVKTNGSKITRFIVPNSDKLSANYEFAWDIKTRDLIDVYSIFQSHADQSISADWFLDFTKGDITGNQMHKDFLYQTAMGMKTRYYVNSKTNSGNSEKVDKKVDNVETIVDNGCGSGGCTL